MKKLIIFIIIIAFVGLMAWAYWTYLIKPDGPKNTSNNNNDPTKFVPLDRPGSTTNNTGTTTSIINPNPIATSTNQKKLAKLIKISSDPVSGSWASTTKDGIIVRYARRDFGNIYESNGLDESKKITTTNIPRLYKSVWANDRDFIGMYIKQGREEVTSFLGSVVMPKATSTKTSKIASSTINKQSTSSPLTNGNTAESLLGTLSVRYLPLQTEAVVFSPKKDRYFYITEENDSGIGYINKTTGGSPTKAFTSPLSKLKAFWPNENAILISTKSTSASSGFVFSLDTKTLQNRKILGPTKGLSIKPQESVVKIMTSDTNSGRLRSFVYDRNTNTRKEMLFATPAEKCLWHSTKNHILLCAVPGEISGTWPDDWYKGIVETSDQWWEIDTRNMSSRIILSRDEIGQDSLDVWEPEIDSSGKVITFINKKDLSLWALVLEY